MEKKTATLNKIHENHKLQKDLSISATKEYHDDQAVRDILVKELIQKRDDEVKKFIPVCKEQMYRVHKKLNEIKDYDEQQINTFKFEID